MAASGYKVTDRRPRLQDTKIYTYMTRWITQCSPSAASLHAFPTPTGQLARLLGPL